MNRTTILETANNLVTGNRADAYGSYREQMVSLADAFNALYGGEPFLEPRHVSMLLMLLKLRRRVTSGDIDSSIDLCGYASLDGEFFTAPEKVYPENTKSS